MSKPKKMHRYGTITKSAVVHDEVCESTATTADEDAASDIVGDTKTSNAKEEKDTCKSELQLLPPPTSWFQPEQQTDSYMQSSDSDQASYKDEALSIESSDSSESVLDDYDCSKAVALAATNIQDDTSSVQSSEDTTSSLNEALTRSKISLDSVPSRTETTLMSSTPTLPETLLPEYDSPDAHMFDLSPLSIEEMSALNQINELATINVQSSITLSAAIQMLVSFSSQTLSQTLPTLLHECSSSAIQKCIHKIRLEYNRVGPRKYLRATDIGSVGGYYCPPTDDSFIVDFQKSVALGKGRDHHMDWMWMDGTEVRFTALPWIERQLVNEWRTYDWTHSSKSSTSEGEELEYDEIDAGEYERARTLAPRPLPQPEWELASSCYSCNRSFNATLHRHHCRRCGHSYCSAHSNYSHRLPHLGFDGDVAERVCKRCKVVLDSRDLEERVVWRLARCRDYLAGNLTPYFETGVDTVEDAAYRLTRAAISLARSIPLGAQAYVALETVEVLRKHGLKGVYGLLLRKEFLAAADLLCRVLGINKQNWPLSVHELSAAIFYALAQHRALRGLKPDGEELIHSFRRSDDGDGHDLNERASLTENWLSEHSNETYCGTKGECKMKSISVTHEGGDNDEADNTALLGGSATKLVEAQESVLDETDVFNPTFEGVVDILSISSPKRRPTEGDKESANAPPQNSADASALPFDPVCDPVPDSILSSLLFYAPLALDFIYAECEVDMQLLAAQQGWRLVFASLDQNHNHADDADGTDLESNEHFSDKPASALFAHDELKIACLSVRGTATIQDVVTDIRAMPVQFPQQMDDGDDSRYNTTNNDWTSVSANKGLALCGMAGAAVNLFRETADSIIHLARNGYKIRIVGHSLGGAVAMLMGVLMLKHIDKQCPETFKSDDEDFLRVYGYGTPSCVDASLADSTRSFVTNVVLHDDVVPRLTPTSIRGLLKHLLYIRETWVKTHLSDDLHAITERAYNVWPTRLRGSFTLLKQKGFYSAKKLKKSCKKRLLEQKGLSPAATSKDNLDEKYNNERDEISAEVVEDTDQGVTVEGELFFDPADPLNESDDEISVHEDPSKLERVNECVPFDEPPMESMNDEDKSTCSLDQSDDREESDSEQPQILEEMPLPRMFIPGKIVHIYTHRGGYKAAYVPRKFRQLRRISLAGNMLSDHMANKYYASLLEVKAIRAAKLDLPSWVGFAEDCTCACCASLFTWASTSNTEAQAARDKHNCRACGSLVCDPCSKKRVPIPAFGIPVPVRVCDRCYNGWGNLFSDGGHNERAVQKCEPSGGDDKPVNSRRSVVVDELAARIPTIQS